MDSHPLPPLVTLSVTTRLGGEIMSKHTISASFKCTCGETVTWDDNVTDETVFVCKNCGANLGTYGDLNEQAAAAVAAKIEGLFEN